MTQEHFNYCIKIGLNIAYYRKEKTLTQETLAEMSGVSRTHMQRIENGSFASLETYIDIASALNIPLYKIFQFRD